MKISEILKDYTKGDILIARIGKVEYALCEYQKILNGLVLVKDEYDIKFAIPADQCRKYDPVLYKAQILQGK
jgi:hypothetical protein